MLLKSLSVYVSVLFITAPSDKERQQLTKSRRATVASSKPSEARTTKTASASSDVDSSEAEADAKVGRKTAGRHGSKTAAAAVSPASSLSTAIVSLEACIIFISPMVVLFHSVVLFAPVTVIRSSYASIRPSPSHHLSSVVIIWRMRESYHNCSVLCCVRQLCTVIHTCWRRGIVVSVVRRMNEVTLCRARLVLGMGGRLWAGMPSRYVTSQLGKLSLVSLRSR